MDRSVSPVVVDRGPGDPEVAVVGGVHGDEPSGVEAIRTILGDETTFERGVRFVIGNPPAYAANARYLDTDLNRTFPGDPDAEEREPRLAAQLSALTDGLPTLSLHSTHSHPNPIALVGFDTEVAEIAAQLPVPNVVDETPLVEDAFTSCSPVITVEAGHQYTNQAVKTAVDQTRAFLAITGAIEGEIPDPDPAYFALEETVEKPPDATYELAVENFERVEAGTTYARADEATFTAAEDFVPVMMSECGYEDIFGYKAQRVGDSLETARETLYG